MGALFGGLSGLGQAGSQISQGAEINRQRQVSDEEFQQKRQEFAAKMAQMQQQLAQLRQQNTAVKWDTAHPMITPDGKTYFIGADPTGKFFSSEPGAGSPFQRVGASKAIGKPVRGSEIKDTAVDWRGQPLQSEKSYQPYQMGNQVVYAEAEQASKPEKSFGATASGRPTGIIRDNKAFMPGMSNWTDDDQKFLTKQQEQWDKDQNEKTEHDVKIATARYAMYLKRVIPVVDSNGNMTFSNSAEINANPGRFAPVSPALQVRNKMALFKEIDATTGLVNDAIRKLPNDAFDATARAQIALVMQSDSPGSAWQDFVRSGFATTLSDQQIEYVTTLASLQESAMAMRSIQGMGAGSDMLRRAITNMLPGPGVPSKQYAQQQMKMFAVEVNSLRTALPNLPGGGGGAQNQGGGKPAGATHIGKDSQGRKHWADAQGNDLGLVTP